MIAAFAALVVASCPAGALNCFTLYPTPALPAASGDVALRPAPAPSGVAVTVDGRPRHRLVATIAGLPPLRDSVYVAWAYTLSLDSAMNLGVVRNGRSELGEVSYVQFRLLVSAERSGAGVERRGRLVLRGTSPSARLLAHRDLMQPSAIGGASQAHVHSAWPMPPMSPRMMAMPGMAGLVPATAPTVARPSALGARPAECRRVPAQSAGASAECALSGDTILLEARPITRTIAGKTFTMYGFNGQSPGPPIDVRKGATVVVRFHNALDVPSSIHWHGVRLDNRFDGVDPVPPGAWFTYTVRFPDAGIYWYHPHIREDIQQALGLYGNMLVRSPSATYYNPVNREQLLTLDDMLIGDDGPAPFGADTPTHALMGRFGNVFLVNGEPAYTMEVKRGEVVRFFLTNVSSARIYNLSFQGVPMKVVGSDGGKFEREELVTNLVIAPAERYVVEVEFPRAETVRLVNRVQALDHMIGAYAPETDTLASVRVSDPPATVSYAAQFRTMRRNADVQRELAPFRERAAKATVRELVLTLRTHDLPSAISNMLLGINAAVDWNDGMPMMNWLTTGHEIDWVLRDPATGKENMDIDWRFTRGDVVKLRLFNDPASSHAMQHPIHLHGQRFLVLRRDGVPTRNLAWKDTVIIPAGETVELLVDMANRGRWMLHCHIAEHLSAGMMAAFAVE